MKALLFLSAAWLGLAASPAHAALQVLLDSNASTQTIFDNGVGDNNPTLGVIDVHNDFLNGVLFNGIATETSSPDQITITGLTFRSFVLLPRIADFTSADLATGLGLGVTAVVPGLGFVDDRGLENVSGVPEPSTWAMLSLGFGLIGFIAFGRRKRGSLAF